MPVTHVTCGSQLWVCWVKPTGTVTPQDAVLSFLPPSIEDMFERELRSPLIRAREMSRTVRAQARTLYINLVARLGVTRCRNGMTLRQAMAQPHQASLWWYHPVAAKDCEDDPTLNLLIAILTVRLIARRNGTTRLVLVGAPREIAVVLKSEFVVEERLRRRASPGWWRNSRSVIARVRFAVRLMWQVLRIRRIVPPPPGTFEVAFAGFWDWSVRADASGGFIDHYFQRLPSTLKRQGVTVGWFAWFDPVLESDGRRRRMRKSLRVVQRRRDMVMLQVLLRPRDIVSAVLDLQPLGIMLSAHRQLAFTHSCVEDGLNYWPLFSERLLSGVLNESLPQHRLVALATQRACHRYRPGVFVTFLEHAPFSRAQYAGAHQDGVESTCVTIQHASYNHEKTTLFLHPTYEFLGEPDGQAIPRPDYVCAMGPFAQELFLECGYPRDQVLLTGSPRYRSVSVINAASDTCQENTSLQDGQLRILMVTTLNLDLEFDMIDALCAATLAMDGVTLLLRNHPLRRIDRHPRFAQYRDRVQVTHGSLEEDLAQADVVLFTYSTVAEEAILKGKPAWQWVPLGFNGSALVEVVEVPTFFSVTALREAIQRFRAVPDRLLPSRDLQQRAMDRLFYSSVDGSIEEGMVGHVIKPLLLHSMPQWVSQRLNGIP